MWVSKTHIASIAIVESAEDIAADGAHLQSQISPPPIRRMSTSVQSLSPRDESFVSFGDVGAEWLEGGIREIRSLEMN